MKILNYKKTLNYQKIFTVSSLLACPLLISPTIFAQTPNDEIIVTATKRAQNIQDVPLSLSVLNQEAIEKLQADDLSGLSRHISNMYLPPSAQAGQNNITIRGIGNGINRSAGRAVGVYIDGVYIGADTAINMAMADIKQVEVLRGPQGTLFGRNTIGGAINITTNAPSASADTLSGDIQIQYGSFGRKQALASANIPLITGIMAVRVSGLWSKSDGYIKNIYDGSKLGRENHQDFKIDLGFSPMDNLTARLSYDDQFINDHPNNQGEPIDNIGSDLIPYTINMDSIEQQKQRARRSALQIDYETSSGFILASTSAWSRTRDFYTQDSDRLPDAITVNQFDGLNEDFSQEFRLSSPQYKRYDYLIGLYSLTAQTLYAPTFPLMSTAFLNRVFFLPEGQHPADEIDGQRIVTNSFSVATYAHGNVHLTNRLHMFGGVRYTHEEKDLNYSIFGETFALFGLPALQAQQSLKDDPVSWTLGARYNFTETMNLYTSASRAYRSAAVKDDFIGQADLNANAGFFTKPEFVINYETGLKFASTDNKFRANASVFYMDYTDIQVSISQEPFLFLRTLTNAAKAHIWGFEADAHLAVIEGLDISASTGFLKTRYDEFMPEPNKDLSGTGFGTAPEWSFSAALDYQRPLADGNWTAHLDYKNQTAPDDFEVRTIPFVGSHAIINASTGYAPDHNKWAVKLWVQNLTNINKPITNFHWGAGLGPLLDNVTEQYEKPRSFGISVNAKFGAQ